MPRTVRNLMVDAVKEGLTMLAHSLFVAMKEGIISANDSEINLPYERFPIDKCIEATKNNILGIYPTYLFAIPIGDNFAMYLSKSEKEAKNLHFKLFRTNAKKIFDMTNKIDTDLFDETTGKYESFAEIRDKTISFPKFVCSMNKGR